MQYTLGKIPADGYSFSELDIPWNLGTMLSAQIQISLS
jgi:hypothetical protein